MGGMDSKWAILGHLGGRRYVEHSGLAYLIYCSLVLKRIVDKATVNQGDQGVGFDMGRKFEVSVRFFDAPLFLEFGGGFSVV